MPLGILLSTAQTVSGVLDSVLTWLHSYQGYAGYAVACTAVWCLLRWLHTSRQRFRTTRLRGPSSKSFLYGVDKGILEAEDSGAMYEAWAREYGPVYAIPSALGSSKMILCDPKAIGHFYAKETWSYTKTSFAKKVLKKMLGKGLTLADGEAHKSQRKFLTPAFSIPAIRQLTPIFYDSAYKAKGAWDALIGSSDGEDAIIDVQDWMGHITLDTIGLAGFSHDFGALEGKHAYILEVFDSFGASSSSTAFDNVILALGPVFPSLARVPMLLVNILSKLDTVLDEISDVLIGRMQEELGRGVTEDKKRSIIGLLMEGMNNDDFEFRLSKDEVIQHIKQLLVGGYETTATSLSWALLELSRNPDVQTRLRNELLEHVADPTFDQLTDELPYLDAVVHEILRIHPPITEMMRVATEDDVIPLSEPVRTRSGEMVDKVTVAKGAFVVIPMESINRSVAIWGKDAKVFRPSRWLEDANGLGGIPGKAKEIQGHRHLLTFIDGPRICLGRHFAVTELKAVLTVLVKNFVFEPRDGIDSKIEIWRGVLPRPRIAGEVGYRLPLRVRPHAA